MFLPQRFTVAQVGDVLRAVYGVPLNPRCYLRAFVAAGVVQVMKDKKTHKFVGWHEGKRRR